MANPVIADHDNRPLVLGRAYYDHDLTVLGSQGTLAAGSVLGIVTASGKLALCDSGSSDGSEVAKYVLTKETDTSGGDVTGQDVLKSGYVNGELLVFGGTDDLQDHDTELRDVSIIAIEGGNLEAYDND